MEAVLHAVANAIVKAFLSGFGSLARARQAMNAAEKNRYVGDTGKHLAKIGLIDLVMAVAVLVKNVNVPFPPIILCAIFFTGLIALVVGLFLQITNNSGDYITVAGISLLAATVQAILALGIAIATPFKSS